MEKAVAIANANFLTASAFCYIFIPQLVLLSLHSKLSMSVPSRRLYASEGRGSWIFTELCPFKIHVEALTLSMTVFGDRAFKKLIKVK